MILQDLPLLNSLRIVLASSSPRRREILYQIGLKNIEIRPSSFGEDLPKADYASGGDYALGTATGKMNCTMREILAEEQQQQQQQQRRPVDLVICADTVVVAPSSLSGSSPMRIIEKAKSSAEAKEILTALSGQMHSVWTGVVVAYRRRESREAAYGRLYFTACTEVYMAPLTPEEIDAYVQHPSAWQGKAGAYGIQDMAAALVEKINGDFFNVMGLPIQRLCAELKTLIDAGEIAAPAEEKKGL